MHDTLLTEGLYQLIERIRRDVECSFITYQYSSLLHFGYNSCVLNCTLLLTIRRNGSIDE